MPTIEPTPPKQPPRRRALKAFGWLGLAGVGAGGAELSRTPMNSYYSGPISDHFNGRRFFNPGGVGPKSFKELARWQFGTRAAPWPDRFPSPFAPAQPVVRLNVSTTRLTAIGHASCLLQTAGLNILFDPVYAERAGPFALLGPKRVNAPGIAFDALPKIDVLLLSHNHYDHMDTAAIARIWQRDKPVIVTPLGNDTILRADIAGIEARVLDWGQSHNEADVAIHCVPTQHWSARGTRDRMHALWSSFVVVGPRHTIYMIGDTGFADARTFRHVAERFPSIDLAWMPIGAYEPQWFMRDQHMNPAEAVQALGIVKARRALGHHWGTFKLTNEAVDTPKRDLEAAVAAAGLGANRFTAAHPGESVEIA